MNLRFEPTVPNILTLIRLLAIPVLAYLIYAGDEYNIVAFIVFASIWLTDLLDGYIARRFNQTTEFGKLFDPLVDKIFQLVTAVMMCIVHKMPIWVPIVIFGKELAMVIGSSILLRKWNLVVFSKWYGKLATVLFVLAFAALFFLPADQVWLANYIFIVPIGWSAYCHVRYGLTYFTPLIKAKKGASQS